MVSRFLAVFHKRVAINERRGLNRPNTRVATTVPTVGVLAVLLAHASTQLGARSCGITCSNKPGDKKSSGSHSTVNPVRIFLPTGCIRWKDLVEGEEMALAGLAFDASRQQAGMAKMAMEIRGLRVPLIEPQPPSVSIQ